MSKQSPRHQALVPPELQDNGLLLITQAPSSTEWAFRGFPPNTQCPCRAKSLVGYEPTSSQFWNNPIVRFYLNYKLKRNERNHEGTP